MRRSRALPLFLTRLVAGSFLLLLQNCTASAAELSESDCVRMRVCHFPPIEEVRRNATVLVSLENCCWNATQNLQLVVSSGSLAQNITVSLQHVVLTQLLSLVTVVSPRRDATRFPDTDGWGSLEVSIIDSYLRLSNFGNVVRVESASMNAIEMRMTRTRVRHLGIGLAAGLALRTLLTYLERVTVIVVEIAVHYSEVSGITPDSCFVVYAHEIRPFSFSAAMAQRQGTQISIEFLSSIVNISAVSASRKLPQSASSQSVVMINSSSLVGGIVSAAHSVFDVKSVYDSAVLDIRRCNAERLYVTLLNSSASVMSVGDVGRGYTLPGAIVVSLTNSFVIDSVVEFDSFNATMTIASGSVVPTTSADATFADATLLYLYAIVNTSVHLRDVFVRGRAIGGDIAPVGGYSSQMMLQLAAVVVNSASPQIDNLAIELEDVRFDVFVEATASATPLVSRVFLQVVYLVQVAATSTSVSVSVANCHLSRWSSFPDRIMLADSRTMLVVAFIDPYAGAPGAALLTATKSKISVVNVTVARMDSEWADASLVGLSGTQVGVDVLVRNVTCRSLSADSAPPDFRSDNFALFFGPGSTLQPLPIASVVLGGALLWSGVLFTGPLSVGGNSVVTFAELSASPLSHFVSKNYMRYGLGTSLFAVSSLSIPHNATFTCHGCVVGSSGSGELHPAPLSAPFIVGLAAPIVGFNVVAENLTFCWPLLAVYFNDSELLSIAPHPHSGGFLSFRDSQLTIGCNYHRNGSLFVVEASSTEAALFNVTYVDGCIRRPQPTPAPPPPTPIPHIPPPLVPLMLSASTTVSAPAIAAAAIAGDVSSLGSMQALAAFSSAGLCSIEPDDAPNVTRVGNETTFDTAATSSPPSPSRFSLSPFIDIGFVEVVLGNMGLTAAVSLLVFLLSVLRALRTPTLGQEVAAEIETLRHSLFRRSAKRSFDEGSVPLTPPLLISHIVPPPASRFGRLGAVLSNGSVWHVLHFPSLAMRATTFFFPGVVYGSVSLLSAVAERSPRVSYASGVTAGVAGLLFVAVGFAGVLATQRHVTALVVFRDGDNLGIERLYQRTAFDRWLYWIGFPVAYCAPHRVKQTYSAFFGNARSIGLVRVAFSPKLVSLVAVAATAVPAIRRVAASCAAVWFALFALYAGVAMCMILTTPLMCRIQCVCAAISAAVVALSSLTRALVVSLGDGFDSTTAVDAMDTAASSVLAATSILGIAHAVWLHVVTSRAKKRLKDQPCTGDSNAATSTKRRKQGDHVTTFLDMIDILLDAHDDGLVSTAVGSSTPAIPPPLQAHATLKLDSPQIKSQKTNHQDSGPPFFFPADHRRWCPALRNCAGNDQLQKLIAMVCESNKASNNVLVQ